jgi:biotin transport system substrate-specific component
MKFKTKDMLLVSIFTVLMVIGAFVRIPFPLLPVTLQPFFCAFSGILLGSRLGALSQLIYVALGLIGLPVFSQGGGIMYILTPSFGFLLGFIAGAFVTGRVSELLKKRSLPSNFASVMAGLAVIYALGIPYMYVILAFYTGKPDANLWFVVTTNLPYLVKDLVLFSVVALTANSILPAIGKQSR